MSGSSARRPEWGDCIVYGGSDIGAETYIGDHVIIGHPGKQNKDLLLRGEAAGSNGATVGRGCVLRANGVLYEDAVLGDRVQTGHHWLVREETRIGDGTLVGSGTIIDDRCTIGRGVSIQTGVYVPTGTVVGDDVFLGPRVCLTNDKKMGRGDWRLEGITIEEGARLGANCTVLPGVLIGSDALIGAGAVITKDVPAGKVVVGNPGVVMKDVPADQSLEAKRRKEAARS